MVQKVRFVPNPGEDHCWGKVEKRVRRGGKPRCCGKFAKKDRGRSGGERETTVKVVRKGRKPPPLGSWKRWKQTGLEKAKPQSTQNFSTRRGIKRRVR